MAEEEALDLQATGEDVTGLNEELLDRLRLLNFEKDYLQKGGKAVSSASFSTATNPVEQFNNFKNLVKWLLLLNDVAASDFSKYDDPMTVSTNILNECKKIQIPAQFPPLKLKTGCGEHVLVILNQLAVRAMKRKNFIFRKPTYEAPLEEERQNDGKGEAEEQEQLIDEAEMAEDDDVEDRENVGINATDEDKQIIHSVVNQNDWKLECERVANKLKLPTKQDTKEWRAHIDSTKNCGELIKKSFPQARAVLQRLNEDLTRTLEKITKSERMINSSMSDVGQQHKGQAEGLKKLNAYFTNLSTSLKEMNDNHRSVSEKLDQVLAKIQQHSGTMTDNSPVVKIKESFKHLVTEIKNMDVRLGVLNHTIMQYKTKERTQGGRKHIEAEELYDFQ